MSTDTGHRPGCSFGRTARCNCTYLAQWDRTPKYTAPTFRIETADELLASGPGLAGKGTLQIPLADGSYTEFDLNDPNVPLVVDRQIREPRCTKPHASYPEWLPPMLYVAGFLIGLAAGYGWGSAAWQ